MWTFFGLRQFLFWVMRLPDFEKSLSDGADEAGMQWYFLAHSARRGKVHF
jgi:hypothetical protein